MGIKVVAAIDFGTHGSGFAWASDRLGRRRISEREVEVLNEWRDQPMRRYPKNLSAVLVRRDDTGRLEMDSWGFTAQQRWQMDRSLAARGYQLRKGFKVALQSGEDAPVHVAGAVEESADDVDQLVTMIIREVYLEAIKHLKASFNGVGLYREDEVVWCVTRPAIWGNHAQQRMRRAAVAAGLPDDPKRLVLVSEPEAAALYCLANDTGGIDEPGARFLVVDAGGGTVDLASYEVAEDRSLTQLAVRNGGKVGSEYLNARFVSQILASRFGTAFVERTMAELPREYHDLMAKWEVTKCGFDPQRTRPYDIMLPAGLFRALLKDPEALRRCEERQNGETASLEIEVSEIRQLFDQAAERVFALVDAQVDELRRNCGRSGGEVALFVGGFAGSQYLTERLTEHLAARDVVLRRPPKPEYAVMVGAVHLASDPSVIRSRRADLTYGIGISRVFDPERHRPDKRFQTPDGVWHCNDLYKVFVTRGEVVRAGQSVHTILTPLRATDREATINLYSTAVPATPEEAVPEYVTDAGVQLEATVTLDISGSLHRPRSDRDVRVTMVFGDNQIEFSAVDVHSGKRVSTQAEFRKTYFAPSGIEAP